MKIVLPKDPHDPKGQKDIGGVSFSRTLAIDLNDFDIDLFLPAFFYTILARGHGKAKQTNNPEKITEYIDTLAQHSGLIGFADPEGRKTLERLVRTTLMATGKVGVAHKREQILTLTPYTLLVHKAGFPYEGSRHRKADLFLYQALREHIVQRYPDEDADDRLRKLIKNVFGRGVTIGNIPDLGGEYDQHTQLDTLTRLSIALLDSFVPTRHGKQRENNVPFACPGLADALAADLLCYMSSYYTLMPNQAFSYHLLALINFELFTYTLKLIYAVNALIRDPETLPAAMQRPTPTSPPHIYLDFTNTPGGLSQEMARACVQRDLIEYQTFLVSNVHLRLLDRYVGVLRNNPLRQAELDKIFTNDADGPGYLQLLLSLQHHSRFQERLEILAEVEADKIYQINMGGIDEEENAKTRILLDEIATHARSDIERVVALLAESQRVQAIGNMTSWYWGTGGLKKPHGLLDSTSSNKQTWRYAPKNDLLAALVQLAATRLSTPDGLEDEAHTIQSMRLKDFLAFLEQHFGILIDRPPAPFDGAEYAAAARENLRAMLRRLRQMGIFRDLSDDFTVQRLHAPYAGNIEE